MRCNPSILLHLGELDELTLTCRVLGITMCMIR
jgi:hypothetical protein